MAYVSTKIKLDLDKSAKEKNPVLYDQLQNEEQEYYRTINFTRYLFIIKYDAGIIDHLRDCRLSLLEMHSILNCMNNIYMCYHYLHNPDNGFHRVNINSLSEEKREFIDYTLEIHERTFYSWLIRVRLNNSTRDISYWTGKVEETQPFRSYYKRVYIDGTHRVPLSPEEYEKYKDIY